jgi:hypothetical protein
MRRCDEAWLGSARPCRCTTCARAQAAAAAAAAVATEEAAAEQKEQDAKRAVVAREQEMCALRLV